MIHKLRLRPPYAQIAILDPSATIEVPLWERAVPLVASDTCILCGCCPDTDGETQITVGTSDEVRTVAPPIFDGVLKTPSHKIALQTVEGDGVLEVSTVGDRTPIRIWSNRKLGPDVVSIGID
jgi:hypothetical protein